MSTDQHSAEEEERRAWPLLRAAAFGVLMFFTWWMWASQAAADDAAPKDEAAAPTPVEETVVLPTAATTDQHVVDEVHRASSESSSLGLARALPATPIVTPMMSTVVDPVLVPVVTPLSATVVDPLVAAFDGILDPLVTPVDQAVTGSLGGVAHTVVQSVHEGVASLVVPQPADSTQSPAEVAPAPPFPPFVAEFVDALSSASPQVDTPVRAASPRRAAKSAPWESQPADGETWQASLTTTHRPVGRPGSPVATNPARASSPLASSTSARSGGGDNLQAGHGAVLSTSAMVPVSVPAQGTTPRATIAGASKNSGSRPAFTPD